MFTPRPKKEKLKTHIKYLLHSRGKSILPEKVKGIFSPIIPYEVRVANGDWTKYFEDEPQKFGNFDSSCCWAASSTRCAEANFNWLWANGMFSVEAKNFFLSNSFCTPQGVFSFSERFHEILSGNKDNGGTAMEAWQSFQSRGFIPKAQLTYSVDQANQWRTQAAFDADYFNPSAVTPAMKALGLQVLSYVKIAYQRIGYVNQTPNIQILTAALLQSPLNYGIPVDLSQWNQVNVPSNINTTMVHEVSARVMNPTSYGVHDQYFPWKKNLNFDYFIGGCIQGVINAIAPAAVNPVPQPPIATVSFWTTVMAWFSGIFNPTVPIGSA